MDIKVSAIANKQKLGVVGNLNQSFLHSGMGSLKKTKTVYLGQLTHTCEHSGFNPSTRPRTFDPNLEIWAIYRGFFLTGPTLKITSM